MLQCTAVARLPAAEALAALRDMSGGPDDADDHLADMAFVLCELGVHDQGTDHAARLWTAEEQPPVGLWFMWTEVSRHMGDHYFATFRLCPHLARRQGLSRLVQLLQGPPRTARLPRE